MVFGKESTNPRERRAYAHAKLAEAVASGDPEAKIEALEAALTTGGKKGKGLPMQAFNTVIKPFTEGEGVDRDPNGRRVRPMESVQKTGRGEFMVDPEVTRIYGAVIGVVSRKIDKCGVEISRPAGVDECGQVLRRGGISPRIIDQLAERNFQKGSSVVRVDWTVPGTATISDGVHAVMWDENFAKPKKR